MNHRVLELLKTPKNIQSEDLNLLREEIDSFPYIQNIRALYLYGVHRYDKENYQKVLSTTAAYTTDKKILYQLINGKIQQRPKPEVPAEDVTEKPAPEEKLPKPLQQTKISGFPLKREDAPATKSIPGHIEPAKEVIENKETDRILPEPRPEIRPVYINGEKNRILFEGEENFMEDEDIETIDLESTLESGSIVTQKPRKTETPVGSIDQAEEKSRQIQEPEAAEEDPENVDINRPAGEFTPEKIVEEEKITAEPEKEAILDESELSFHETEAFVPEVQVQKNEPEEIQEPEAAEEDPENADINRPAEEFTPEKIIEEEKIPAEPEKEAILDGSELSFHETEAFIPEIEIQKNEPEEVQEPDTADGEVRDPDTAQQTGFTSEKVIDEDEISSEKEKEAVQDDAELSFHGTESFLPEVKIQANSVDENSNAEIIQSAANKHEDEMRRLIEKVEKRMKEKAVSDTVETQEKNKEPEDLGSDISFAETQRFEIQPSEPEHKEENKEEDMVSADETQPAADEKVKEADQEKEKEIAAEEAEEPAEVKSVWKPMSFESNLPDSLLSKPAETSRPETEVAQTETADEKNQAKEEKPVQEETLPAADEPAKSEEIADEPVNAKEDAQQRTSDDKVLKTEAENKEEAPVMNVSFFGSGWSIAPPEKDGKETEKQDRTGGQEEKKENTPVSMTTPDTADSNIPGFINTWQSWLKIDRTEEVEKEKVEIKAKVIEAFIENNPKISQLKDEVNFVVKEKGDDISHLMTETLANLYAEQKLYTKAIKAFEILIGKIPEKEDYFKGKIKEIKDFRNK